MKSETQGLLGTQRVCVLGSFVTFLLMQRRWLGLIGLWEGLLGGEEVQGDTRYPLMWWKGAILAGVGPMIMGSEAGLTYGYYSESLMDGRWWPRLARKQIATLSPREVLFYQASSLWFPWQLLKSGYICSVSAELLTTTKKHKDPVIYNLW